ncbi:serine hydrolase [Ulvibacterium sp.]|uniref:serine hydrolase domain-containing protein n=1 Tax=Ulvibacterium sp. TaxID=2665914 RepID=UPI0026101476|nr:serine hydrolase domain-containing protein [Ulvibacterium sp.]
MKNSVLILWYVLVILGCNSQTRENTVRTETLESVIAKFEDQLNNELENYGSISGAIVVDNQVIWSKAFGVSDSDKATKADTTTIYRTGSISKPITAFLMMQLVQEGTITLSDPVELYLPEIKKLDGYSDARRITFQHLAAHTSGLIREPKQKDAAAGPIAEWEAKVLESIANTSFQYDPEERFSYSNIGYGILGLALSRAADKPFMELIEEKIFEPLQMDNSYFIVPEDQIFRLSKGLETGPDGKLDREKPQREHMGRGYKVPNGGIYSTPNDLAKFILCNLGLSVKLLSRNNLSRMQTIQTPKGEGQAYGLGFGIQQDSVLTVIGHSGGVAGYRANLAFDKDRGNGVVLMKNYSADSPNISKLSFNLLKELAQLDE